MPMNSPRAGLRFAAVVFGIICLGHLWRLLGHVDVRISQLNIPEWPSVAAVIGAGLISVWLWRLSMKLDRA